MSEWQKIVDNLKKLDLNSFFEDEYKKTNVQKFILDSNRNRLRIKGVDILGKEIRTYNARGGNVYSNRTIDIKRDKGQPTSHVTLYDTGRWQGSFALKPRKTFATIESNKKSLSMIEDNVDMKNVLGLTDQQNDLLANMLAPSISKKIVLKVFNV